MGHSATEVGGTEPMGVNRLTERGVMQLELSRNDSVRQSYDPWFLARFL